MNKITLTFIVASLIVIFAYDYFALIQWGGVSTISETLYGLAKQYPIVAFLFGVMMGHLFWNMPPGGK